MTCSPPAASQTQDLDTSIIADNQEDTYQRCLKVAGAAPQTGIDMALRWRNLGGGEPARHCLAVSMMMAGDSEAAAPLLETLAQSSTATAPVRAGLYRQAGQAWMANADYTRAVDAYVQAATLLARDATIHLDIALAHAALGDYWSAVDDLNTALDFDPFFVDALVLRGSAYRLLELPDLAADDLKRAIGLEQNNTDALLEMGLLARENGEDDRARQYWVRVLETAPNSAAADAVRRHIEEMDVIQP